MDPALRPYVWMLCGSFWFSLMGLCAHAAGELADWRTVALVRSALATLFALTMALATGAGLVFARPRVLWLRSIAGSCSLMTTFYALTHMPVSDVLTITNTFPVWVALMSWPVDGERPTWGVWGAVACAVLGVAVTQQGPVLFAPEGFVPPPRSPLAPWSALAASLFTAMAMMGLNRLKGVSALGVVVHFSAVSAVFCLVALLLAEHDPDAPNRLTEPFTLGLLFGVGATATLGQVFLTRAFRAGPATKVSVAGLSQVVMALAVDAAVGWKPLTPWSVGGTLMVLGPVAWLMARDRKPPPPPPVPDPVEHPPDEAVPEEAVIE